MDYKHISTLREKGTLVETKTDPFFRYSIENETPVSCPFCNPDRGLCLAATSSLVLNQPRKLKYCLSEDFDDCPYFLFRCLRSSPVKNYSRHIEGREDGAGRGH